ncbi:MAG: GH3 auxin-responsive promoter family protein [Flavobacteriales bacterium]
MKATFAKLYAAQVVKSIKRDDARAVELQFATLKNLLSRAASTQFGKDHQFHDVADYSAVKQAIPVRDYEDLLPYIKRAVDGETDVLWPGRPKYFCKTSGTTSGTKYIPLTRDSMPNHIGSARNALLSYIHETKRAEFVQGKMIFLQGSPKLDVLPSGIPYGRLSGIVANHVPAYLQRNRMPSYPSNCIEDWEEKVHAIVRETMHERMTLISGIPNWVQMYFEALLAQTGSSTIRSLFPDFSLFVFGGVNFEPYRSRFRQLIGADVPTLELYPASEGFIAYQDSQEAEGLRLNVNDGIFFEFIPADEYFNENPSRLSLAEVKLGVNYALVMHTNAGMWGYSIGDTVRFVSLAPYRIKVTGRIKHYTSAFGEHVIAEEVEHAMEQAQSAYPCVIHEFHVAPQVNPLDGLPYHEWFIEASEVPSDIEGFARRIDECMQGQNIYYRDLISGRVLQSARLHFVRSGAFNEYMKSVGKLGGQNKVPRLSNDRKIAEILSAWVM